MNSYIIRLILVVVLCAGCTTYELSLNTLEKRFAEIDSSDLVLTRVKGPFGETYSYLRHPGKFIPLENKEGEVVEVKISPSLEMKVTHDGGQKSYFYFDKVYVTDKYLIGDRSRFMDGFHKEIRIESIEKIEVQDGKKNFKYY